MQERIRILKQHLCRNCPALGDVSGSVRGRFRESLGRLSHVYSHGNFVYVGSGTMLTKISFKEQINLVENPTRGAPIRQFSWNELLTKLSEGCYRFDAEVTEETGLQAMR